MGLLLSTLLFRWYVFFFWGVGLVALSRATGMLGGVLRFAVAWGVAYLFEWSSARPGGWFPFGHYQYLPTTKDREIWLGILPLMDSLSFAFLAVGALGLTGLAVRRSLGEILAAPGWLWRRLLPVAVLLFTAIDMVIDPVALRGSRWFLGQIYDYPDGGAYFGVTLSNFVGWAVTGTAILVLWRFLPLRGEGREEGGGSGSPPASLSLSLRLSLQPLRGPLASRVGDCLRRYPSGDCGRRTPVSSPPGFALSPGVSSRRMICGSGATK